MRCSRSRCSSLVVAARLALALTGRRGDAQNGAAPAWQHVQLTADAHPADAGLTAALVTAQHAPAYVRAHYLLALLHWLLADLAGKGTAGARVPRTHPNDSNTPEHEEEADAKHSKNRTKRSRSTPGDADAPAPPSPANMHGSAAPAFSSAVSDPKAWWLLAALLSSPTLPHQEAQAGAVLKPLLAACRAAADPNISETGIHNTTGGHLAAPTDPMLAAHHRHRCFISKAQWSALCPKDPARSGQVAVVYDRAHQGCHMIKVRRVQDARSALPSWQCWRPCCVGPRRRPSAWASSTASRCRRRRSLRRPASTRETAPGRMQQP